MGGRTGRIFVGLGISGSAILVTFLLFEIFFRLFFPQSEYALDLALWGFTHKPNAQIHYQWHGHKVPVRYNSKGLRGPEYDYAKPLGVFRILILGDSWAEDMASFYENLYSTRLERKLNQHYQSPHFEVINAGHYAFDNTQELMFYLKEGRKYYPDLVVVLYALDKASSRFAVVEDGTLRLHYQQFSPTQHMTRASATWVRMHSHFGSFVLDRLKGLKSTKEFAWGLRARLMGEAVQEHVDSLPGPVAVFPPVHPNVANLPPEVKEELIRKGVIRVKPEALTLLDWYVWKRFGEEVEKDGARLIVFQIWPDSLLLSQEELRRFKILAYNFDVSSIWGDSKSWNDSTLARYKSAVADGTYDPRLDSHRWGYAGNEPVAQQMFKTLTEGGFLPPHPPGIITLP